MVIFDYVKALFSKWWSGLILLLGLASTAATFLPSLFSRFHLVMWAPPAIAVLCWAAAPVSVYLAQRKEIAALREELGKTAERTERSQLSIRSNSNSRFYYETTNDRHTILATRVFLNLSIENNGNRNSTVRDYRLQFPLFKVEFNLVPDAIPSFESRAAQHGLSLDRYLTTDGIARIPPNDILGPKELTFRVPYIFPISQRELDCILTITDMSGTAASHTFKLQVADLHS